MAKKEKKRGSRAETLKIEGNWKEAAKKALRKKKPSTGWPKPKQGTQEREEPNNDTRAR